MNNDGGEKSMLTMNAMQQKDIFQIEKREQFHEVNIFAEGLWLQY